MAQDSTLAAIGLHTAANQISSVPKGSLVEADNAVVRFPNTVESRRGQKHYEHELDVQTTFGSSSSRSNEGVFYNTAIIHQYDTDKLARIETGTGNTNYSGSYIPVDQDSLRMKFVEIAKNLYFNTTTGQKFLDSIFSTPLPAGTSRAAEAESAAYPSLALVNNPNGWMAPDTAANYQFVYGSTDLNGNIKLGPPSPIFKVKNRLDAPIGKVTRTTNVVTVVLPDGHFLHNGDSVKLLNPTGTFGAGPFTVTRINATTFTYPETAANATSTVVLKYGFQADVELVETLVPGLTTSHFVRLYRSEETNSADDLPSEEVFEVDEKKLTSTNISDTTLVFDDRTPSSQLGPPLYTNPNTGNGAIAAKFAPPIGKDITLWDGRMWCLNTKDKHRFNLRLLGIGSPDGLQANDTITIAGVTFKAVSSTGYGSAGHFEPSLTYSFHEFIVWTDFDISTNIEKTARDLVQAINFYRGSNGLMAYYNSSQDGSPGEILLEEQGIGGSSFSVYSSRPTAWGPALTSSPSGAPTSTNDMRPHGASFSEIGEPEAFRLTNFLPVAPVGYEILRGAAFRDKLFVFCSNRKILTVSGTYPYRIDEIDGSALLLAPDSVKVHNNQVMAFTDQGIGIVTDAGLRIVSLPIDDLVRKTMALDRQAVKKLSFGLTYEDERLYQLWVPTADTDVNAKSAFVWNSMLNAWTTWSGSRRWGNVSPFDGKLHMGDGEFNRIRQERKSLNRTDYADEQINVLVSSVPSSTSVVLVDATGISVGDVFFQSVTQQSLVTAIDGNTLTLTKPEADFIVSNGVVFVGFQVRVKWTPILPLGPCQLKNFRDCTFHFREFVSTYAAALFDSETYAAEGSGTFKPYSGYGLGGFGDNPFGGPSEMRNRKIDVTKNHQQAAMLRVGFSVREAYAQWGLWGFTVNFEVSGESGRP